MGRVKLPHWVTGHLWEVVECEELVRLMWGRKELTQPVTLVLYRCACGANKTEEYPGHWTKGQLMGR